MPMTAETLAPDRPGLDRAAAILRAGGRVAFATETVYGLGADARQGRAVAGIFEAKGRPRFNPLIAHVATLAAARALVEWSAAAERLAEAFWPGPLTLVLPLRPGAGISGLVTAGLSTLAVRVPAHPAAQALLAAMGGPVAAPSANLSGRVSPTTAVHVAAGLGDRIEAILDAGPCGVGVESTIIGLAGPPALLRPGGVAVEAAERVLGQGLGRPGRDDPVSAPGQIASHYAPAAGLRLQAGAKHPGERLLGFGPMACDLNLSASGDLAEAAASLFGHLHDLDARDSGPIAVAPIPETGLGLAINDRLRRAAAPRPGDGG